MEKIQLEVNQTFKNLHRNKLVAGDMIQFNGHSFASCTAMTKIGSTLMLNLLYSSNKIRFTGANSGK